MNKSFTIPTDRELVEQVFDGKADITHEISDRYTQDVKDALRVLLDDYDKLKDEVAEVYEMERHIEKIEAMLVRRKVRYKKWEDRYL